jgi:hypothetical protein
MPPPSDGSFLAVASADPSAFGPGSSLTLVADRRLDRALRARPVSPSVGPRRFGALLTG